MSNLRLGEKNLRAAAGDAPQNGVVVGQNQWAVLRAAHASVGQMPTSQILVRLFYQARNHFQNKR
ncbi:hypothetical protein CL631_02420 [bacterium]|nr:hypothetical protein [bacterium]